MFVSLRCKILSNLLITQQKIIDTYILFKKSYFLMNILAFDLFLCRDSPLIRGGTEQQDQVAFLGGIGKEFLSLIF